MTTLLTVADAAKCAGVSKISILNWYRDGRLPEPAKIANPYFQPHGLANHHRQVLGWDDDDGRLRARLVELGARAKRPGRRQVRRVPRSAKGPDFETGLWLQAVAWARARLTPPPSRARPLGVHGNRVRGDGVLTRALDMNRFFAGMVFVVAGSNACVGAAGLLAKFAGGRVPDEAWAYGVLAAIADRDDCDPAVRRFCDVRRWYPRPGL